MTSRWPFTIWEIDLIGQLPKDKGGAQYVVVAVDYFTKCVEVEALAPTTPLMIKDYVYRNVIC